MKIVSSEQLIKLIEALSRNIVDAAIHWKLVEDLGEAHKRFPLVIQQSNTFWSLTFNAHTQVALQAACRAYDQEKSSLHLLSFLQLIEENIGLFDKAEFRKRLAGNPFVDSLAKDPRTPDLNQLKKDKVLCSADDPLVKKLLLHRNNAIAHTGRNRVLKETKILEDNAISIAEFESLITRAVDILNKYSLLFRASSYSTKIVGNDDHQTIFRWIQDRVENERDSRG
jgi:hypothetical protein